MKKIILILLFIFVIKINSIFAYMPISTSDIIIGKIDKVKEFKNKVNGKGYEFNFKNYINYKINTNDILDLLKYRKKLLSENTIIFQNQLPSKSLLKKGNIIVISRYSGGDGLLKIGCKNNLMYIEGIKNKVFLSVFENGKNRVYINEVNKYKKGLELGILKKINKKVGGCEGLKNFFDKDRTLEDLDGKNLEKYIYFGIGVLIILIMFFIGFKIYKK